MKRCSCTYEDDAGWYECDRPIGHEGRHHAPLEWEDLDCAHAQHTHWDEALGRMVHKAEPEAAR